MSGMKPYSLTVLLLLTISASAADDPQKNLKLEPAGAQPIRAILFAEKCSEIVSCAAVVSEMTGQKYLFDQDIQGGASASANLEMTRENAELLFTALLNINGFMRQPLDEPNTYLIVRQRDGRDGPIPILEASVATAPVFLNTWDFATLKYKATNPESVEDLARLLRSFMPANSRIIPSDLGGFVYVTAGMPDLKRIYEMLKTHDQRLKPSAVMKKKRAALSAPVVAPPAPVKAPSGPSGNAVKSENIR